MKKTVAVLSLAVVLGLSVSAAWAAQGIPATDGDIKALKDALRGGIIQIGKTRLKEVRDTYGEPKNMTQDAQRITYNYGDIRIEFSKLKKWKSWEYDSFKTPAYTDDIDNLRFDLESGKIVGKNITLSYITKEYGEPTESHESEDDGELSTYYYGDIKLVFENMFVVRSWRGSLVDDNSSNGGVLGGATQATAAHTAHTDQKKKQ